MYCYFVSCGTERFCSDTYIIPQLALIINVQKEHFYVTFDSVYFFTFTLMRRLILSHISISLSGFS